MKNITVVGSGYVGFSLSILLARQNNITIYDIDQTKINEINQKKSPIKDKDIEKLLKEDSMEIFATSDSKEAFMNADIIIIATPTDYNPETNYFNTNSIEVTLDTIIKINRHAIIVIKSTVPIGYTEKLRDLYNTNNIIFSPEFLREGKALHDNLYPSRIIIGSKCKDGKKVAKIFKNAASEDHYEIPVIYTNPTEAESIKLFSNTYLAMRIAFFNELDTFSMINNLNTNDIINGVSSDSRIGNYYNNPSFGYGGYCLPKDSKQLLSNFSEIPNEIIKATVKSNEIRKSFLSKYLIDKNIQVFGVFKLVMKKDSDNYRSSAIIDIIKELMNNNINVLIYEPLLKDKVFLGAKVTDSLREFKEKSEIIISNRMYDDLYDVNSKVFTRDIFGND